MLYRPEGNTVRVDVVSRPSEKWGRYCTPRGLSHDGHAVLMAPCIMPALTMVSGTPVASNPAYPELTMTICQRARSLDPLGTWYQSSRAGRP
jgi:hypothetical protein